MCASKKWGQASLFGDCCGILRKNVKTGLAILAAWMQPVINSLIHSFMKSSITLSTHLFIHVLIDSHNPLPNLQAAREGHQGPTGLWVGAAPRF